MRRNMRRVGVVTLGVLAVLYVVGSASDGVERWKVQNGETGETGSLVLERTVHKSTGRPPGITSWAGTYTSDNGDVERFVRLGESLPDDVAAQPGSVLAVRWQEKDPDIVFLAEGSRAFTNWVEGVVFLAVILPFFLLAVVLWRRRRVRTSSCEGE